jgi:acylphosphatase
MAVCKRALFWGRVQGVGFRYVAERLAEDYPIAGSVRNLPAGAVELIAEGETEDVDAYVQAVKDRFANNIERAEVTTMPVSGQHGFHIRY